MKKFHAPYAALLLLFSISFAKVQAQVLQRDSVALVDFYNTANGPDWFNKTNWLTGNVSTWYGVKTNAGRVSGLYLPANNLSGSASDSLRNLTALKSLILNANRLTQFPSLSGLSLDTLKLQNNALTFRDLLPNKTVAATFQYAPQDSIDMMYDTLVTEQNTIVLSVNADNTPPIGDNYEWYRNGTSIVSSASNVYSILCMDSTQAGTYTVAITNSQLPLLTLNRRMIRLSVRRLANPGADFSVCGTDATLQGEVPSGGSVKWTVISGGASITNDTMALTAVHNLAIGTNVLQYSVSANNISCGSGVSSIGYLTIMRDTNPGLPNAGADQSVCRSFATLSAITPTVGTGNWTVTKGTGVIAQPGTAVSGVSNLSSGENIFRWILANGACAPGIFDEVKIFRDDTLPTVSAGPRDSTCFSNYDLKASLPTNTSGVWTVISGSGIFTDATSPTTNVSGLQEYSNVLRWTVANSCNVVSNDVEINVFRFLKANAGADREVFYSPIVKYALGDTVASGGNGHYSYVWGPTANIDSPNAAHPKFLTPDAGTFTFELNVSDSHGCMATDEVTITVVKKDVLDVPTLFTPNNDGLNDEFYVPGIESYPDNELIVFDRNNQVVYRKQGYRNDWKGINEEGFGKTDQLLPADTYFYTLKTDGSKPLQKGFFLIKY